MSSMSYVVVEFSEDVVSSNWIFDEVCMWPPYRATRLIAAKKKWEEPTNGWEKNPVRILKSYR